MNHSPTVRIIMNRLIELLIFSFYDDENKTNFNLYCWIKLLVGIYDKKLLAARVTAVMMITPLE